MEAYLVLLRVEFTLLRTVASRTVRSYRTLSPLPVPLRVIGGLLSAALVVGLRPPGVTWHPALWSPDFPPLRQSPEGHQRSSDYPVNSDRGLYRDSRLLSTDSLVLGVFNNEIEQSLRSSPSILASRGSPVPICRGHFSSGCKSLPSSLPLSSKAALLSE